MKQDSIVTTDDEAEPAEMQRLSDDSDQPVWEDPGWRSKSREYPSMTHLCSYACSHTNGSTTKLDKAGEFIGREVTQNDVDLDDSISGDGKTRGRRSLS